MPRMRAEPHRLIFLDETSTTTKMTRLRGRAPCTDRLIADAPFGHWGTQTFIAGLRCDELIAPWIPNGPMNRAAFDTYVETQLAPCLSPGDVVILDNLSSHKSATAQACLKAQGNWMLFLPPYSPDLRARFKSRQMATFKSGSEAKLIALACSEPPEGYRRVCALDDPALGREGGGA